MAYFPMFIDMEGKRVLAVGAGNVGARRIQTLLKFGAQVTAVAPKSRYLEQTPEVVWLKGTYEEYREALLTEERPFFLVLAATGDRNTDRLAVEDGRAMGAFVNAASDRSLSDFYFPGTAMAGEVTAGVVAGGKNHRLARIAAEALRELFEEKGPLWELESGSGGGLGSSVPADKTLGLDSEEKGAGPSQEGKPRKLEQKQRGGSGQMEHRTGGRAIRIGSRDSLLAVRQSELVMEAVRRSFPGTELELVTMKTTGDRILGKALDKIGGKGLFVKELDLALLEGRSDLSVHSLKDMPMDVPEELPILAYSPREDERDVLILREGLSALPERPVIGTGSRRRSVQASRLYPDAVFKGVRGNIHTRLRKLDEGEYDALILAAAGIRRMGLSDRISRFFSVDEIIPPAGQGILAVQGRRGEDWPFLDAVRSPESEAMALAERSFVRALNGGCSSPVAACASLEGGISGRLVLRGFFCEEAGGRQAAGAIEGQAAEAKELGIRLAERLQRQAAKEDGIRGE